MTSGLPPGVPERRRAGVLDPVAVPVADWLPFFVVLLGTVLLSVVRGCGGAGLPTLADAIAVAPWRATVGHEPDEGLRADPSWACRHPQERCARPAVPERGEAPRPVVHLGPVPATTWPSAARVGLSVS